MAKGTTSWTTTCHTTTTWTIAIAWTTRIQASSSIGGATKFLLTTAMFCPNTTTPIPNTTMSKVVDILARLTTRPILLLITVPTTVLVVTAATTALEERTTIYEFRPAFLAIAFDRAKSSFITIRSTTYPTSIPCICLIASRIRTTFWSIPLRKART